MPDAFALPRLSTGVTMCTLHKENHMRAKAKRERAIATPRDGSGMTRHQLYIEACKRIESATAAGYFLEAITLLESILADRLESRASYLTDRNEGYQSLGPLIRTLRQCEIVADFRPIIEQIDAWRKRRNEALHEVVKFSSGERPTWEDKVGPLPEIVREGKEVLLAFCAVDERDRRKNGARPAATEPAIFGDGRRE
jgi:hypothetical protein